MAIRASASSIITAFTLHLRHRKSFLLRWRAKLLAPYQLTVRWQRDPISFLPAGDGESNAWTPSTNVLTLPKRQAAAPQVSAARQEQSTTWSAPKCSISTIVQATPYISTHKQENCSRRVVTISGN